ncbi:bifunctional folylpolyglutamate synthase/dihydrofolate synthase [Hujiaoplasma nucleasis]|uniref:tetrahydrofolate synthase n=1 Tax=Hujiaoplasma nucleasis TaxID=2725268 RepID=A0A7L6N2G2_9MOLU|nr:folylpolyglutamate synthase/dihydrofolate synthase family protein [Hujiaoplasma nucleasis]QLY39642.1 bifunctional folylpolyglutamate synthase/dihydrofolate synthase [Hujiaoplasma nucleasis]
MFTSKEQAQNWIENIKRFGSRLDLSRISKALEILGNPHKEFKSIHVAGTNGKGSTTNYIKNILVESGFKVGLYTSPYVVDFNERIKINHHNISDESLVYYTNILHDVSNKLIEEDEENIITFFEVLTVISFLYFRDEKVDFAVIEVGLGGLLDATNVIIPEVSVITNVSYDHMKQLGNSLESIALNKLGIVKENVPLITAIEDMHLFPLIYEVAASKNARVKIINHDLVTDKVIGEETTFKYQEETYVLGLPGYHQIKNACLAIETIRLLRLHLNLDISEKDIKVGLKSTKWPGRFEIFDHRIVIDGAHNIGGIQALKKSMRAIFKDKNILCLFSVMKDKQHKQMIEELDNFCDELYFTEFDYQRRADAEDLFFESTSYKKSYHHDYKEIFYQLKSNLKANDVLLVTGSLYFISEIRKLLV